MIFRGIVFLLLGLAAPPVAAQFGPALEQDEVAAATVASGRCEVPVCADVDFGDFKFRYYARGRAATIRSVPAGACVCKTVVDGNANFNGSIGFTVELPNGHRISGVHLTRNYPPSHSRARSTAPAVPTIVSFEQEKADFEPVENFTRKHRSFPEFDVWAEKKPRPKHQRRYYFLPKVGGTIRGFGREQPVAFVSPLGWFPFPGKPPDRFTMTGQIAVTDNVFYYQFLDADRLSSAEWIDTMRKTIPVVEQHIIRK